MEKNFNLVIDNLAVLASKKRHFKLHSFNSPPASVLSVSFDSLRSVVVNSDNLPTPRKS